MDEMSGISAELPENSIMITLRSSEVKRHKNEEQKYH